MRSGAGRLALESHGAVVTVVAREPADAALLDVVRALLPVAGPTAPHARADAAYTWARERPACGRPLHVVTVCDTGETGWTEIARSPDADEAAARLAGDAEFRIALHARGRLFVHAAAVGWNGRAILLPGRSFSGKSTLAAALVRAGAAYLSDEYAVLGEDGLVHPFPRRLRLRDGRGAPAGSRSAEELHGTTATAPLPVGLVVWTGFRPGARWRPRPLEGGRTALALLDNTVVARLRPAYALRVIARALDGAVGVWGPRGEAEETAGRLLAYAEPRQRLGRGSRRRAEPTGP